ncbi:DUF2147 domain-containing protein [uncultured Algibacter sp.]|uniref:DUF2147 domain-containing protein n=1 Tax=uncultured Algibacter sp. TaxID=298659 RepID=UPI0026389738|nr:DUF2147 domain-containing protein [uncultured Algibacter sp.]
MRRSSFFVVLIAFPVLVFSQDVFGKWKTVDDETGEEKSVVEIYEENGKVFGRIVEILNPDRKNALCNRCEGSDKNKPISGMIILKNMKKGDEYYEGGTIFDPSKGKKYKCKLWLNESDTNILNVRGYIAFLFATQHWKRVVD